MELGSLKGYKPEEVKDDDGFDVFTGKNLPCKVNSSIVEDVEAGSQDGRSWDAYKRLKYELEVEGESHAGRRLWKSYNLTSEEVDKKGKTPAQKLADLFFTLGLGEFSNLDELQKLNEQFASKKWLVTAKKIPAGKSRDGKDVQLHTITGEVPEGWEEEDKGDTSDF